MPLWLRPVIVLAVALALLVPVGGLVDRARDAHRLKPSRLDEAPQLDEVALTTGLGAARSFLNISTWNAIEDAQREREYYRVIALSRTALRLQPNNPDVLDFLARQLIFTLSRTEAESDDAWGWVEQGMDLIEAAHRRNPHSAVLRRALGSYYYQMMSEHPVRLLEYDLTLGADGRLARDKVWRERAEEILASYHNLEPEERARLDHVIERVGHSLVYVDDPRQFSEYDLLGPTSQRIYKELNLFRHRMAVLEWAHALNPGERVEGGERYVLLQRTLIRLRRLHFHAAQLPRSERAEEQAHLWKWLVRLYEWVPDEGTERSERARRMAWNRIAGMYDQYGAPPNAVPRNGIDLVEYYFGRDRPRAPAPLQPR